MEFRRAMRYPPFISLVNTVVRARTFAGAMDDAADYLVEQLRRAEATGTARARSGAGAARQTARRIPRAAADQGHEPHARCARALQTALAARPELQRRVVVDVDPLSVL